MPYRRSQYISTCLLVGALCVSLTPSLRAQVPRPPKVGTVPVNKPVRKVTTPTKAPKLVNPKRAAVKPRARVPIARPAPKKGGGNNGVVRTQGTKTGTVNTGSKKIQFDPKKFGKDGATGDESTKVEDVIEWKTNFEKGIKCKKIPLNAKIRLDFNEISLSDLTKFISCITEQNFLLSTAAKKSGTVSILSPKPVTAYEAYKAFLSALEANGLTIVKNGKFNEIVGAKVAKNQGADIRRSRGAPNDDRIVTRLIQLSHVPAEEVLPVLDKFKTANADITVYGPTNTIILTDTGRSILRLVKLLRQLDVPTGKEKIWIRPIQYADAPEVIKVLTTLFGGGKGAKAPARKTTSRARGKKAAAASTVVGGTSGDLTDITITKMIADDRTNSIIFIASKSVYLKVDRLIRKLDVPVAGEGAIHIHYLENADAKDISSALSSLTQGSRGSTARRGAKKGGAAAVGSLFEGEVKITSYEQTNALIIESSRKDYLAVQRVIRQLDIRRKQVYVEAILMEISQDKNKDVGVSSNGGALFEVDGEQLPLVFGAGGLPGLVPAAGALGEGQSVAGFQGPLIDVPLGTDSDGNTSSFSLPAFSFLLKAIQTTANINVLSTPHILTLDNEKASIEVGKRQPYRSSSIGGGLGSLTSLLGSAGGAAAGLTGGLSQLAGLGGGLGSQVQFIDIDLKLEIEPQVNSADFVKLKIMQSMDELAGFEPTTQAPITTKRKIENTVVVRDGQPAVIGGLLRDAETESVSKVPILGDIPLLGVLFRSTKTTVEKRNLLLIVIPHVIKDPSDLKRIHEQRRKEFRELAAIMAERRKEYTGQIDYRKKNGLMQSIHRRVQKARKERELRESIILESSDVDTVGPPETHDVEYNPKKANRK